MQRALYAVIFLMLLAGCPRNIPMGEPVAYVGFKNEGGSATDFDLGLHHAQICDQTAWVELEYLNKEISVRKDGQTVKYSIPDDAFRYCNGESRVSRECQLHMAAVIILARDGNLYCYDNGHVDIHNFDHEFRIPLAKPVQ